ncbi:protein of unknown function [Cyanobium sp. NIES-981]|nr:protein of unknown function [Cyanobium sp. NIES-981]
MARFVQTEQLGVGGLVGGEVLAGGLAEHLAAGRHVQDVVDDLEGQADAAGIGPQGREQRLGSSGDQGAAEHAGPQQRTGLVQVDVLEGVEIHGLAFALQVHHLATHQTRGARGQAQLAHHGQQALRRHPGAAQGHHLEGAGEQGIAGQDGVGFPVHLVIGGAAAAQVVVIHGGQIVMDQRHGVDHLQGHRRWHGPLAVTTGQLTGRQAENRPQPLAPGQQGIAHRLAQGLRSLRTERSVQGRLHPQAPGLEIGMEVETGRALAAADHWVASGGVAGGRAHRRGHGEMGSAGILSGEAARAGPNGPGHTLGKARRPKTRRPGDTDRAPPRLHDGPPAPAPRIPAP